MAADAETETETAAGIGKRRPGRMRQERSIPSLLTTHFTSSIP